MATYSERIEYKEEILPNQVIQLRTATIVLKDGVEIGRQYHREVFSPGDDVTGAPQEVQDIATALWSAAVVEAYVASIVTEETEEEEEIEPPVEEIEEVEPVEEGNSTEEDSLPE